MNHAQLCGRSLVLAALLKILPSRLGVGDASHGVSLLSRQR